MTRLQITVGELKFVGTLEEDRAPKTCALFKAMLPYQNSMVHACWSGEAGIVLLTEEFKELPIENGTNHPGRGDILFYPGGPSEPKILFPYGSSEFNSKIGPLAGSHFITITEGQEQLAGVDRLLLWQGAQAVTFQLI